MRNFARSGLCLWLTLCSGLALSAETGEPSGDTDLDQLLQGFEEPAASAPEGGDEALDAVLKGFDDEAQAPSPSLEAIIEGFEDTTDHSALTQAPSVPASPFDSNLTLRASAAYNIDHAAPAPGQADYRGLSRARLQATPELRWKTAGGWRGLLNANFFYDASYAINGRDQYTEQVLESNQSEAELRELYIQGSLTPDLDIKIGRQIVVWGKSDSLRVVDVLNPLDSRETGLVDIEDLRLPVAMAKADYYVGNWQLSGILIPEIRFNKTAPYGSDFYPAPAPPASEIVPADGLDNMEYAMALSGRFQGWDMSFHAASIYNDSPYLDPGPPPSQQHSRLTMGGIAFTAVSGSFLYKAELAYFDGLQFFHGNGKEFSRVDTLLGVDYSGFRNTTLTLEVVDRYLLDYQAALQQLPDNKQEHESAIALRYTQTFLHERMELSLLAALAGNLGEGGGFYRTQLSYDLSDELNLTGGGIFYQDGDSNFFKTLADNDRLFVELKYEL